MIKENLQITNKNLSLAWADAFLVSSTVGISAISPLTISIVDITSNEAPEHLELRNLLDRRLLECREFETHTTANTIFPISLWNPSKDPEFLYSRYKKILPALKKADTHNRYDLYFERLIAYETGSTPRNQLTYIINTYRNGNHRKSALQAAIFDPNSDQTDQQQRGFPCLQQIAFVPMPETQELAIHGFYATQYLFERAYGNLLGLFNLGLFMAAQLNLKLARVSCTAAFAKHSNLTKEEMKDLQEKVKTFLNNAEH